LNALNTRIDLSSLIDERDTFSVTWDVLSVVLALNARIECVRAIFAIWITAFGALSVVVQVWSIATLARAWDIWNALVL
jgi:hypothetical protein